MVVTYTTNSLHAHTHLKAVEWVCWKQQIDREPGPYGIGMTYMETGMNHKKVPCSGFSALEIVDHRTRYVHLLVYRGSHQLRILAHDKVHHQLPSLCTNV